MKRAGLVFLLGTALVCASSCGGNDEVKVVLLDPCLGQDGVSFRKESAFTEVLLIKGGCPSDAELVNGDVQNVVARKIAPSTRSVPTIGDVSKETYGFTVLLKDDKCGVVGFGCTQANMANIREVRIAVRAWADGLGNPVACPACCIVVPSASAVCPDKIIDGTPQPRLNTPCGPNEPCFCCHTPTESPCCVGNACPASARPCCQVLEGGSCPIPLLCGDDGRCSQTPSEGGGAKGCDLTVLNGGPLPKLLATTNTVSGPGLVGTGQGFLIGYREVSSDGQLHATLIPVSPAGQLGTANRREVTGCASQLPTDGIGMAFASGKGLFTMSLPNCGGGAGAVFIPFESDGVLKTPQDPKNPSFSELTLARDGSVAAATQIDKWEFMYRAVSGGAANVQRALVVGNMLQPEPAPDTIFPDGSFGMVVTGGQVRAFIGPSAGEAGTGTAVQLSVPSQGEPPAIIGELSLPAASWAAATAWTNRVAVGVPATSGLSWLAASVSSGTASSIIDSATIGSGAIAGADLVVQGDNLLFALGKAGEINLLRVRGAKGALQSPTSALPACSTAGSDQSCQQTLSGAQMAAFDGKQLAVAASGSRLAVVWLTPQQPNAGGYAILQCADE
jgi:hypothetical protein